MTDKDPAPNSSRRELVTAVQRTTRPESINREVSLCRKLLFWQITLKAIRLADNRCMDEREMLRRWARTWKEAAPELEAIRRREIREADNLQVLALLENAFNHATRSMPPRPSSGMVEMQAHFAKLRR